MNIETFIYMIYVYDGWGDACKCVCVQWGRTASSCIVRMKFLDGVALLVHSIQFVSDVDQVFPVFDAKPQHSLMESFFQCFWLFFVVGCHCLYSIPHRELFCI